MIHIIDFHKNLELEEMHRIIVIVTFFTFLFLFTLFRYCKIYYAHSLLYRDQQSDIAKGLDKLGEARL